MLIGREKEFETLMEAYKDDRSHFIAIYGRRRIGKTFLVRETFNYTFTFQHAGMSEGSLKEQIKAFDASIKDAGQIKVKRSKDWIEAFEHLKDIIRNSSDHKKVIFIDELSWMDTPKGGFIPALENFWNGWASGRKDILLIVCSSATSWMISKIIHNKGGLYNRLTETIALKPFDLLQCEEYIKTNGFVFNRDQILNAYMVFGGVPYYWSLLKKGLSMTQNIDELFFSQDAPLKDEYRYLFSSIFKNEKPYVEIVKALGGCLSGLTREELIKATGILNSGDLTKKLEELESCGFIRKYQCFGKKKKDSVYRLIDFYTLFYYHFSKQQITDENFMSNQINTPAVNTWLGLAFERVCFEHIDQIKRKLGIEGVLTQINSWSCTKDLDNGIFGSQIDLLISRKDQIINLCEIKYSKAEYTVTNKVHMELENKIHDFKLVSGTRYAIHPTLITCYGLVENSYSKEIQAVITMDDLYK